MQGLTSSPRPILAVPHLLAGESSAYYHAYLLAEMGVSQTRAFFLERDGFLTDNARIGPALAEAYWKPGNAQTFEQMLATLTGQPLAASALIHDCNRSVDESLAVMQSRAPVAPRLKRRQKNLPAGSKRLDVLRGAERHRRAMRSRRSFTGEATVPQTQKTVQQTTHWHSHRGASDAPTRCDIKRPQRFGNAGPGPIYRTKSVRAESISSMLMSGALSRS